MHTHARSQGAKPPPRKFFDPLEKYVGHILKLVIIVHKFWAPRRKLFAPPSVLSWLQACACEFRPVKSKMHMLFKKNALKRQRKKTFIAAHCFDWPQVCFFGNSVFTTGQ